MGEFNIRLIERRAASGSANLGPSVVAWAIDPAHLHQPGASDIIFDEIRERRESLLLADTYLEIGIDGLPEEDPYNRTLFIAGRVRNLLWQAGHTVNMHSSMYTVSDVSELWSEVQAAELH